MFTSHVHGHEAVAVLRGLVDAYAAERGDFGQAHADEFDGDGFAIATDGDANGEGLAANEVVAHLVERPVANGLSVQLDDDVVAYETGAMGGSVRCAVANLHEAAAFGLNECGADAVAIGRKLVGAGGAARE
jgi:hypothetical protein